MKHTHTHTHWNGAFSGAFLTYARTSSILSRTDIWGWSLIQRWSKINLGRKTQSGPESWTTRGAESNSLTSSTQDVACLRAHGWGWQRHKTGGARCFNSHCCYADADNDGNKRRPRSVVKLILHSCRQRKKGKWAFSLTQYANWRSLAELMFIHTNGINLQTQSKLQREEKNRTDVSSRRDFFQSWDPWWRACDSNYWRQLAGRSHLQMFWACLLAGCWVYFDTSGKEDLCFKDEGLHHLLPIDRKRWKGGQDI